MVYKGAGKLFFQAFLLLVLLFGLVRLVMIKSGGVIVFELLLLAVLLMLSVLGLATSRRAGSTVLFVVFLLYALNLIFLWYYYKSLYLVLFLTSLLGLWISIPSKPKMETSAPPQKVVDGKIETKAEVKEEPKEKVKTTFTPGKYVASKRSNVYHEPKCDWAKKIQKDRQIWFVDRKEALNKGYKKHSCVN